MEQTRFLQGVQQSQRHLHLQDTNAFGQFHSNYLINAEEKDFSVIANRATNYLITNGFIDTSVQMGGVPGVPGYLEHSSMIWEVIQRAKSLRHDFPTL